jgi:Holliday junction resolvasome RuvABC DNA-binding subunit
MDAAIRSLETSKGTVTGQAMMNAIVTGAKDPDNQAAGLEFADMQKWVGNNQARLSPEAKQVFATYEKAARNSLAQGKTGITDAAFKQLQTDMAKVATPPTTTKPTPKPTPKPIETKFDPQKLVKTDASASKATAELKAKPGQISGSDMTDAISKGVSDLDGQAANAEFKEFQKFAKENGTKLSPEAKEVMGIYEKYAKAAQGQGKTGIEQGEFSKMLTEMRNVKDSSATKALAELDKKAGTVTGDEMARAIQKGTADLDGQAAGAEYDAFKNWAQANQAKLSPEAKQVMEIYKQHAEGAKAKGGTGIPQDEWKAMLKEMKGVGDISAKQAISELEKKAAAGTVTGDDLAAAIEKGTADADGQAAGKEFAEFEKFAKANQSKLSPEAKEVMKLYREAVADAKAKGQTGIPQDQMKALVEKMKNVGDVGAKKALAELDKKAAANGGTVSGDDMAKAIQKGTADLDGQSASKELAEFEKWAKANESKLSPEAKEVLDLYRKAAGDAKAKGQTGIAQEDWNKLVKDMKNVGDVSAKNALAELDKKTGTISGEDLAAAIDKGTQDADGQAAGKEFAAFEKWAKANESRLSPEAKEVMDLYRKAAADAKAKGQTGIPQDEMKALLEKMKNVGDSSAKAAISELDKKTGTISGDDLAAAIDKGTQDADGQAAGKEFEAFEKWAKANESRLSPEAKEVMDLYRKAAAEAKAKGQTGIPEDQMKALLAKMKDVGDVSAKQALAQLDQKAAAGTVSGDDLLKAIKQGTADLDGQAAGKEFAEFEKWAKANEGKLSPEAKEVMGIYKKYVDEAKAKGQTGISEADSKKMFREMRNVGDISAKTALAELAKKSGPVSGEDMAKTIKDGISDLDGNSSTKELKEFQKWAKANPEKLTPEAKQVLETYEKYAKAAGKNGISQADSEKMLKEMEQFKTYSDDTTRAAIDTLNTKTGPISGADLTKAITQGTQDTDGQAAGLERADFAKWAGMNKDRLSPEAQQVMAIYERYANRSLAAGQTGIPQNEWKKMIDEMNNVGKDRFKAFITG